jgi:hypothetical protein
MYMPPKNTYMHLWAHTLGQVAVQENSDPITGGGRREPQKQKRSDEGSAKYHLRGGDKRRTDG